MLETGQNWELFGYDMRQLGKHWLAAWRRFLWASDSPVRRRLDEVVCLHTQDTQDLYQAGEKCGQAPHDCDAVLLPDELVLTRILSLPVAVEDDIDAVLALEVNANSPFSAADTGYGWQILSRDESQLNIALAIVSLSSVMAYLGRCFDIHDARAREVWLKVDGVMVVVRGFGEGAREGKYYKRLWRTAAMLTICSVLVLLLAGVAAGTKRAELMQIESLAAVAQREAANASSLREVLALGSETIIAANRVVALYPNPHYEIARLTRLLADDAFIVQFSMDGREMRLRGRATDAASVMQKLTDEPAYAEVTAPQAIVKVGNSGLEQFSLNITLGNEVSQ